MAIHFYCRKCRHVFAADDPAACPLDGGLLIRFASRLPLVGETIGFRYQLTAMIGVGGVCTVYSAVNKQTKQRVGVKVMRPDMATQDCWRNALMNEVELSRRLNQENLVKVHEGGITPGGYVYMVMDLLEGETLATRLLTHGRLGVEDSCRIAGAVARGLSAIHAAGCVHRDVKPENIFIRGPLSPRGVMPENVRLMDLGVAGPIDVPRNGPMVEGTPTYMSPEQVSGGLMDQRSDLYSLGVVLFEMLSGRPCFDSTDTREVMMAHIREPSPRLPESILSGPTGEGLAALTARLLGKDREERPGSADEVAVLLDHIYMSRHATNGLSLLKKCV